MGQSDLPTAFRLPSIGLARRTCLQVGFRFRHTSVSGFPLSWLIIRIPYRSHRNRWDLSSSRRFSSTMPGARDLGRPSGISPRRNLRSKFVFSVVRLVSRRCHAISIIIPTCRFLCVGFRLVDNVATCIFTLNEAESLRGGASPLWPSECSVYASRLLFACAAGFPTDTAPPAAQDSIRVGG